MPPKNTKVIKLEPCKECQEMGPSNPYNRLRRCFCTGHILVDKAGQSPSSCPECVASRRGPLACYRLGHNHGGLHPAGGAKSGKNLAKPLASEISQPTGKLAKKKAVVPVIVKNKKKSVPGVDAAAGVQVAKKKAPVPAAVKAKKIHSVAPETADVELGKIKSGDVDCGVAVGTDLASTRVFYVSGEVAWQNHFYISNKAGPKCDNKFMKRIQHEVSLLEGLPEEITVCVSEDRLDLMSACIKGPQGTPYQDGLFFFDIKLPPQYPAVPPLVHFHSADKRMNPNLYACGKVCLSLLGTWPGQNAEESWNADQSSICQVLLSIMALILVPEPWYNEPGFESMRAFDVQESRTYTEAVYLMNLQLMIRQIKKPPILFQDFVKQHYKAVSRSVMENVCRQRDESQNSASSDSKLYSWTGMETHDYGKELRSIEPELRKLFDCPASSDVGSDVACGSSQRKRKRDNAAASSK